MEHNDSFLQMHDWENEELLQMSFNVYYHQDGSASIQELASNNASTLQWQSLQAHYTLA
jgi:hypothetical protein